MRLALSFLLAISLLVYSPIRARNCGWPSSIPVHFHVIRHDPKDYSVTQDNLVSQVKVVNDSLAGSNIRFYFSTIDYTTNLDWYFIIWPFMTEPEKEMKHKLHQGGKGDLNVYVIGADLVALGWSSFPWEYNDDPEGDGIVILSMTLPGDRGVWADGLTLPHEIGHWLGCFHLHNTCLSGICNYMESPAEPGRKFIFDPIQLVTMENWRDARRD